MATASGVDAEARFITRPSSGTTARSASSCSEAFLRKTGSAFSSVPSDTGTPSYEQTVGKSIYYVCGNSYYMNTHGEFTRKRQKSRLHPSTIVMYEEANLHFLLGPPRTLYGAGTSGGTQGVGWHGRKNRFNVGFLDLHAADMTIDPRKVSGPGWNVTDFFRIWGWIEE